MLPLKSNQHDKPGLDRNSLRNWVGWMKLSMQKTAGKDDKQEVTAKRIFCPSIEAVHTYCTNKNIKLRNTNATKTNLKSGKQPSAPANFRK